MSPDRKKTINGIVIEEYTWNGKSVVYVNNRLSERFFDAECRAAEELGVASLQPLTAAL
jgi:hypothetical protein